MGKLGKETKTLLIAITAVCLISFLLAGGIATLLAKNFQQELLLHDYGVAGHLLNNEKELSISAFTSQPNENDIERGREALASIGYDETASMRFLPAVQDHDYDIELWAWGPDYADPTAILAMFESDHPSNYSLWSSDEFDKLYNEANTTLAGDETARWDNLIKCNDICTENAGCIPLFQTGSATLTKSNVTGITEHNTGVPCYYKFVEKD